MCMYVSICVYVVTTARVILQNVSLSNVLFTLHMFTLHIKGYEHDLRRRRDKYDYDKSCHCIRRNIKNNTPVYI